MIYTLSLSIETRLEQIIANCIFVYVKIVLCNSIMQLYIFLMVLRNILIVVLFCVNNFF